MGERDERGRGQLGKKQDRDRGIKKIEWEKDRTGEVKMWKGWEERGWRGKTGWVEQGLGLRMMRIRTGARDRTT